MNESEQDKKTKRTPKRRLKDISFDHEGAHLALTSTEINGGPANLTPTALVTKGIDAFSAELIEKASMVQVTLTIEDFLQKFFGLYYEDAEVLARAMGYETTRMEQDSSNTDVVYDYNQYIQDRVDSFSIMKSLYDKESTALDDLEGEQYLKLLQDQELLEKSFEAVQVIKQSQKAKVKKESGKSANTDELDNSTNAGVEIKVGRSKPVGIEKQKETTMTAEVKTVVADVEKELVEKAVLVDLQKAMEAQTVELAKALELVKQFEQDKKEAITKSRKEKLAAAIKNEQHAEVLFKGANLLEDTDFDDFVKTVATMQAAVDNSELFKEIGSAGEVETQVASKTTDIRKAVQARLAAKQSKK